MHKNLRAIARRLVALVFLSSTLISLPSEAQTSPVITNGVKWLSSQVQTDGSLQNEMQSIATPLQNRSEAYTTLQLLTTVSSAQSASIAANPDGNTEYLSRQIITLSSAGSGVSTQLTQLAASNNPDGGYGGAPGYASTPLDTAFALIALKSGGQTATVPAALAYLQAAQQADGSFLLNGVEDIYSSIYVLAAFRQYASTAPVNSNIQFATSYLMAQQSAPGVWNNSVFLTALAYPAVHDFIALAPTSAALSTFLTASQQADGSWNDDPYVTAVVLRALNLTSVTPANPGLAIVQGTIVDSQTGLPLTGVTVTLASSDGTISNTVITLADGTFMFAGLNSGNYAMSTTLVNYASIKASMSLSAGQTLNFGTLQLIQNSAAPTGTLRGVVTDAVSGAPLAGATVSGGNVSAISGANGTYQIANVAVGSIALSVSKAGYQTINSFGTMIANGVLVYSPAMTISGGPTPPSATITGSVIDTGTNLPLVGVAISATDANGSHNATTDANGNFSIASMVGDANGGVALSFSLAKYAGNNSYAVISGLAAVNMGQIRLRALTATQLLPDLAITGINRSAANTDPQTPILSGSLSVTVQNIGGVAMPAGVNVLAFQDINKNRVYDAGTDQVLGTGTLTSGLAVGQSTVLQISVSGTMPFRDAPITVWADSGQVLLEITKSNNIKSTGDFMAPPPFSGPIQPVLKWGWYGGDVIATPMVGPLTDTNGDGKYDANDIPTVLVVLAHGIDGGRGQLTALSGKDGTQLWQVADPNLYTPAEAHPAIADLDGSGAPQVIAYLRSGGVAIFKHDGTLKCTSTVPANSGSYYFGMGITVADLDGDGKGEIIAENYVLNNDCSVRLVLPFVAATAGGGVEPIVADLDGDGKPEIILPSGVYHSDGSTYWTSPILAQYGMGQLAVARFDPTDPHPQLVSCGAGLLNRFRYDGTPITLQANVGGCGGAPLVVDLDGNGIPSIGSVALNSYWVLNTDNSVRWEKASSEGSWQTASTAFDFYQDGKSKIIYGDEHSLSIWDDAGNVLFTTPNFSATASEYPVVADVDGSGHAAILVVSNGGGSGCCGLRVFQDVNNAWPATRKIWNEYAYHVTNVNDDGSLPKVEPESWNLNNNYRVNPPIANAQPDVSASYIRINDQGGAASSVVTVRVGNAGGVVIAAGLKVALYSGQAGGTVLGTVVTSVDLNSDDYQDVTFSIPGSLSGIATLVAVADDDGTGVHVLNDFDIANNTVSLSLAALQGSFNLAAVSTDQASYLANANVQIAATITNHGSFDGRVPLSFVIQNASGQQVATIPAQVVAVAHLGQQTTNVIWNTGTIAAGTYTVVAQLLDANGNVTNQLLTSFAITGGAPGAAQAAVSLTTDKQSYLPTDTVIVADRLTNLTANTTLNTLNVVTTVSNPAGTVVFTKSEALAQLPSGALKNYSYSIPLSVSPPGSYNATVQVTDNSGATLAQSAAHFTVVTTSASGNGLTGSITLGVQQVPLGNPLAITYSATNSGNSPLTGLPLTINIIDPVAQKVMATFPTTQTIAMGTSYAGSDNWTSAGTVGNTYVAVLSATVGGNAMTLAQANFTLITPPIKLGITQSLWNSNRILVLTACTDSSSNASPVTCTAARYVAIDKALTGLGLPHVMTTNATAFTFAMRTGLYDTIWIASDQSLLGDDLTAEVSEVVYDGATLIVDGAPNQCNANFDLLGGVKSRNSLASNQNVTLNGTFYPTAQTLPTVGTAQSLTVTGSGQVQASFTVTSGKSTSTAPALVSNVVGAGRTLIAGFDLGSTLSTQSTVWASPLNTAFVALTPSATANLTPGEVLPIQTGVANQANAVAVDVQTTLPTGALYLSTPSAVFTSSTQTADWDYSLAVAQSNSVYLTMRAPGTGGSFNLQTIVSTVNGGTDTAYGNPLLFPITVTPAATTAAKAITTLQALTLTGKSDQALVKTVVANINQAMSNFNLNTYSGYGVAIGELVNIADSLGNFSIANTAPIGAIHAEIDQILQETQWRWTMTQPEVNATLAVDKTSCQPTDTVTLAETVTNITSMTVLNNLNAVTTVTGPAGTSFFTKTEALTQFIAGEKQIYSYSIPVANAAPGNYAVSMVVSDANGNVLAKSSATFSVSSTATTGAGLTGTVVVSPTQIPVGSAATFTISATDQGNSVLTNLPLTLTIIDTSTQRTVTQYPYTDTLNIGAVFNASSSWSAAGNIGDQYQAVLSASLGSLNLPLAKASFTLIAPPLQLTVTQNPAVWQNLLVFSQCKRATDGMLGQCGATTLPVDNPSTLASCDSARASFIDQTLGGMGIAHTISTNADDFRGKLRSGLYNSYWISNGATVLGEPNASELRAAVTRGGGLIVDGLDGGNNPDLATCAGVAYQAPFAATSEPLSITGPLFASNSFTINAAPVQLRATTGTTQASLGSGSNVGAGIVSGTSGNGKTLAFGFDWVSTLETAGHNSAWPTITQASMSDIAPSATSSTNYVAGDTLTLNTTLQNAASASVTVQVAQSLPNGANVIDAPSNVQMSGNGSTLVWNVTVAGGSTQVIPLHLQVPETAGNYIIATNTYVVNNGQNKAPYQTQSFAFTVQGASQLLSQLIGAVQTTTMSGAQQQAVQQAVIAQLNQAQVALASNNNTDEMLRLLLSAQTRIARIDSNGSLIATLAKLIAAVEHQNAQ